MLIPKWALRISLGLRKFTLDFLPAVLRERDLKSVSLLAWALGLSLSQPGDISTAGNSDVTHFRDA